MTRIAPRHLTLLIIFVFITNNSFGGHIPSSKTEEQVAEHEKTTEDNSSSFFVPDSAGTMIMNQNPQLGNQPNTTVIEAFLDNFTYNRDGATGSEAELLRVIYGTYGKNLEDEINKKLLFELANMYNLKMKSKEAYIVLEEIEKYKLNEVEKAYSNYYYAMAKHNQGIYDEALDYYLKAIYTFEQENNIKILSSIYSDLGILYSNTNENENSISNYLKAVAIAEQLQDTSLLARYYSNIGTTYKNMEEDKLAIDYYKRGQELSNILQDSIRMAQNLMNIGNIYKKQESYLEAHQNYLKSLEICQLQGISYGVLLNFVNISENARKWKRYQLAMATMDSALNRINLMELPLEKVQILRNKTALYEDMNRHKEAIQFLKEANKLEKEIFDQDKRARIDELTIKYETTIKEKELENASIQIKSSQQSIRFLVILSGFILISTSLLVAFYRSRVIKIKALYLKNLETLAVYKENRASIKKQIDEKDNSDKNTDQFEQLFEQINQLLIHEEAYKDADLNLNSLAQQVKSNTKYVSQSIQQETSKNFNTYINHLRIMEAQKLIQESYEDVNLNLNDVMYACGFKSRSTFYTAFQKETGMSPKQYKDLAISEIGRKIEDID